MKTLLILLYLGFFISGFITAYGVGILSKTNDFLPIQSINESQVSTIRTLNNFQINLAGTYYITHSRCTGSMKPIIYCTNQAIMKRLDPNETINIGDIIVFKNHEYDIARHQVIDIKDGCYVTKGINNLMPDSECTLRNQIEEKVVAVIYT